MNIIAHRGAVETHKLTPNSIAALTTAIKEGFSFETDIRSKSDGTLVISHDPLIRLSEQHFSDRNKSSMLCNESANGDFATSFNDLLLAIRPLICGETCIAIHIKEYKKRNTILALCDTLVRGHCEHNFFLFDLLLNDVRLIKECFPTCRLGVSIGEKRWSETIYLIDDVIPFFDAVDIIWADEWCGGLYSEDLFEHIRQYDKEVYVVSPELHVNEVHPFARTPEKRWQQIRNMQFSGICTDFPLRCKSYYGTN